MKILLVEDHGETRVVLSGLLGRSGHEVAAAGNVQEALQLLEAAPFEVLICDIGLPDGTGLEVLAEAKKHAGWKKMLALTAHDETAEREQGLRAGFDEYLTKPFDFHELRSLLGEQHRGRKRITAERMR
jgi:DNA-binding response OmpR family regulator